MPSPIAHIAAGVAVGLIVHKVVSKSITVKPSYDKALGYYPLILLAVSPEILVNIIIIYPTVLSLACLYLRC